MKIQTTRTGLEIAVIGLSGRFPGALNLAEFWGNLVSGTNSISLLSDEELRGAGVHPELIAQKNFVKAKGIFPDLEYFDADFFEYTPRDAALMDPQVRALHQGVYHALEDAGYASEQYKGSIGLFLGASGNFLWEMSTFLEAKDSGSAQFATLQLNDKDFVATRIAYKLNLRGPSVAIHCACSTSLYAIDVACRNLLTGSCSMAVCGGSGLTLPVRNGYLYETGMIKSADGSCRPFSDDANGTVEGNGMGLVVLKPLEDALRDRDRVYAVIRATAANNDGARKVGYNAPSVEGQAEVIRRALHIADVQPESVTYVEAHGTGTALGDPVEVEGLKKAFRSDETGFCGIGSLKSNIGHLDTAAGISSFIKTVLALEKRLIPPSIHFRDANPNIDFSHSPFYVITEATPWENQPAPGRPDHVLPLRAGVSSFGIGGTNVHVVLEEAPAQPESDNGREWKLLCLSARDEAALGRLQNAVAEFVNSNPGMNVADLAYTFHSGRRSLPVRAVLAYRDVQDLQGALGNQVSPLPYFKAPQAPVRMAFLFSGQGTQYPGMGIGLYSSEPAFKEQVDRCLEICDSLDLPEIRQLLLEPTESDADLVKQTEFAQPGLFIVEYALARLLMDWGIVPTAMIGHSLGEYVAACIAGVFSLERALDLVVRRGRLMGYMSPGSMLAVSAPEAGLALPAGIDLAAVNSPFQCTVSGPTEAIEAYENDLREQSIGTRRLQTSHAFHSAMMEPALESFMQVVSAMRLDAPKIPYLSNVSGTWITAEQAQDPAYYVRHLRETVRFAEGAKRILEDTGLVFAELGPGNVLCTFLKQNSAVTHAVPTVSLMRHGKATETDAQHLVHGLGTLWGFGVAPDWKRYYRPQQRFKLNAPLYPFERRHFPVGERDIYSLLAQSNTTPTAHSLALAAERRTLLNTLGWQASALPPAVESSAVEPCLLFGRNSRAGKTVSLVEGLRLIQVRAGMTFTKRGYAEYQMNFGELLDYRRLARFLKHGDGVPGLLIWVVDGGDLKLSDEFTGPLLRLAIALRDECPGQAFRCIVLIPGGTPQRFQNHPDEGFEPDGLARGLRAACLNFDVRCVGFDQACSEESLGELVGREIFDSDQSISLTAYQGNQRWVYRPQPGFAAASHPSNRFRGQNLGLLAPDTFPLDELAALIGESSGARILPLTWKVPQAPVSAQSAIDADTASLSGYLRKIQMTYLAQYGLEDFGHCHALMDELSTALVADYIHTQMPLVPGQRFDREGLKQSLRIVPHQEKYLDYFIDMLAEDGLIVARGEAYEILHGPGSLRPIGKIKQELESASPLFSGQVRLLEHCVTAFDKALPGAIPSIEVLYPEGRNELLRATYEGSIQEKEDEYIRMMFEKLSGKIIQDARGKRLRILEVGGGYGNVMRRIVPLLRDADVEYYFTDIGKTFLEDAKSFAIEEGYRFLRFGVLDITQDSIEQGLETNAFDVVFAFNVVHATRNLGITLGNMQRLLKPGGVLGLLERTKVRRYVDLIWGLADGWWHFDEPERSRSPLLDLGRWEETIRRLGFTEVMTYPDTQEIRDRLDVGLLIARNEMIAVNLTAKTPSIPAKEVGWQLSMPVCLDLIDGLLLIEPTPVRPESNFPSIGGDPADPCHDYAGYVEAMIAWLGAHRPGFVSVWSSGSAAAHPSDEMARIKAAAQLDTWGGWLLGNSGSWSRVYLPLDVGESALLTHSVICEALRAIESGLAHAVIHPERQDSFSPPRQDAYAWRATAKDNQKHESLPEDEGFTPDVPKDGCIRLLQTLWSELFGLEKIGLDDDFFALGGDSLKVAQLTTELEKHGIRLLSNEVFARPTIRSLAEYILTQRIDEHDRVQTPEDIVRHYRENLRLDAAYQTYELDGQEYRILFVEDSALAGGGKPEQSMDNLKVLARIQPHYILPLSCFSGISASGETDSFWGAIGITENAGPEIIESLAQQAASQMAEANRAICAGPVDARYTLTPFQKMYQKESQLALYLIEMDETLDLKLLDQAFTALVKTQGLFRTELRRRLGRAKWVEHAPPDNLSIPLMDLSGYSPVVQAQLFERIMALEYGLDLPREAGIRFRVQLIIFNRRRYTLMFNVDHAIFDNMSGQILRNQFIGHYRALLSGKIAGLSPVKSYRQYLEQRREGPQGINEKRLIQRFDLERYGKARDAVEQRILAHRQKNIGRCRYSLNLTQFQLADDDEATWELSMIVLCLVLERFLGQKEIPLKLLYQGRKYQDQSYFDTIGLFIDVVPLMLQVDRDNPTAMINGIRAKLQLLKQHNISFTNLLFNPLMWLKWGNVISLTGSKKLSRRDPMILLNYVGKAEKEYQKIIEFASENLENLGGKMDYASFYSIVTVVDGHINFDVFCSFERNMDVLLRLFEEEARYLAVGGLGGGNDRQ
jgi:acyl transferase domain-containing protein/SAM-dependent methyltransferase